MKALINRFCESQCVAYFRWFREKNGLKQAEHYGCWPRRAWFGICSKVEFWTRPRR